MSNPTQPPHDSGSGEREVRSALEKLVAKIDEVAVAAMGVFEIAAVHGCIYRGPNWADELAAAKSALAAPSQAVASALQAPEGWKLVPIEPTVEMLMAAEDAYDSSSFRERRMYAAMLAAAPAHPVVQPAPECQQCHQPKTLNPHPKAGDPSLEFGYVWECIPCLVRTRSSAVKRYCAAESALKELQSGHQAGASLLLAGDSTESGSPPHASDVECWEKGAPDSIDRAMAAESAEDPAALFAQANCLGVAAQVSGDAAMAAQAKALYLRAKQVEGRAALASKPSPSSAADWVITAPDGRQWHGESPLRACAAAQRDTIDPVLAMQRINAVVDEENAIRDKELADAYANGRSDQVDEDRELLRWAWQKLRHIAFSKQEDAMQLDLIEMALGKYDAPAEPDSQSRVLPPEAAGQDGTKARGARYERLAELRESYGLGWRYRDLYAFLEAATIRPDPTHHTGTAGSTTPEESEESSATSGSGVS